MKRKMLKVPINSGVLYDLIEAKTSIRKLGPAIGFNEKTIRRGLKANEMSLGLVMLLAAELKVQVDDFADILTYCKMVKAL